MKLIIPLRILLVVILGCLSGCDSNPEPRLRDFVVPKDAGAADDAASPIDAAYYAELTGDLGPPELLELTEDEFQARQEEALEPARARFSAAGWKERLLAAHARLAGGPSLVSALVTDLSPAEASESRFVAYSVRNLDSSSSLPATFVIEQSKKSCLPTMPCPGAIPETRQFHYLVYLVPSESASVFRIVKKVSDEVYGFAVEIPDLPGEFQVPGGPDRADRASLEIEVSQ